jgi:AraC-like DNA-binding protein
LNSVKVTSILDSISPFVRFGGEFRDDADLFLPGRVLYDHLLEYLAEGRADYTIEGDTHRVDAGQVVLIPPRTVHTIKARGKGTVVRQCVHFDFVFEGEYASMPAWEWHPNPIHSSDVHDETAYREALELQPVTDMRAFPRVGALFSRILSELYHAEAGYQLAAKASMIELLLLLQRQSREGVAPKRKYPELPHPVAEAKRYIDTYYPQRLTLASIAAVAHYHPVHLERLFKRHLQTTVGGYITSLRVRKAKELLRESNTSIAAVGEAVGFGSPQHFSSVFHETTGMAPRDYRKKARGRPREQAGTHAQSFDDYPIYEVIYDRTHCSRAAIDKGMGRYLPET